MSESTSFINFPDKPRQLKFTLSAVRQFRVANNGVELWRVRLPGPDGVSLLLDNEIFTRIVWAGLLHLDPRLTVLKVEGWLEAYLAQEGELEEIYKTIAAAFEESGLFGLRLNRKTEEADAEVSDPNV